MKNNQKIDYFIAYWRREADIAASAKITQEMEDDFHDVFLEMECLWNTFSLQVSEGVKPY